MSREQGWRMTPFTFCLIAGMFASSTVVWAGHAAKETVLYSFLDNGADGTEPYAGLIDVKGTLFGTTAYGGTYNDGTVFSIDPATGAETVVYSFGANTGDGANPTAIIQVRGHLYGTTGTGGTWHGGTVFKVDPATGTETVLHAFRGYPDGSAPTAGLIDVRGTLYGTTSGGGEDNDGTVFSIIPATKTENVEYSFKGPPDDGDSPVAVLINVNGTLYGMTELGGMYDGGTVYNVDLSTRTETVVHSFCGGDCTSDGNHPDDPLIDVRGTLYGTTGGGGTYGEGTVFSLDPSNGTETVLYSFQGGEDGAQPIAGLLNVGGTFYGTTGNGGSYGCDGGTGCGTVFSFDRESGREKVLHAFQDNGTDGAGPEAGLINLNGTLYGTTVFGGSDDEGTVFEIKP
jgi:uncharacterized repeat protein (TIGR03803 family)